MRILIAHNRYQQKGGEDNVVTTESELLRANGHTVDVFLADNDYIQGLLSQITASVQSVYSLQGKRLISQEIRRFRPDVVHVHNFFPTLSPAIFRVCADQGIPVVHTLHNYRIVCAAATLFRDGHICEECIKERSIRPGIRHACYRGSRLGSTVSGATMAIHDYLHTWQENVTAYIALTEFAADKLGSYRIPRSKIHVKPNSSADRGTSEGMGDFALFVGRLTPEKGIRTLLAADRANALCIDIVILGDGPLRQEVQAAALRPGSRLKPRGFVQREVIEDCMRRARVLLMPSLWYEGLPLVILEAFSFGLPVIAADLPNARSVIIPEAGLLFPPGDPDALAAALEQFQRLPPAAMRAAARQEYLRRYTPEANYAALVHIYERAIAARREDRFTSTGSQALVNIAS